MLVALALFAAVFTLMAAPYLAAFTLAYRLLARYASVGLPFLTAAAWAAAELLRGRLLTGTPLFIGNPWGLTGYAHVDNLALMQIVSVTGIYGVSFAIVCVNASLAELWIAGVRGLRDPKALLGLSLAALPAIATLGFGFLALRAEGDRGGARGGGSPLLPQRAARAQPRRPASRPRERTRPPAGELREPRGLRAGRARSQLSHQLRRG